MILPECCLVKCIRRTKQDIYFDRARQLLSDEIDIVKILRQIRFVLDVVKELVPAQKLAQLRF